MQKKTGVRVDLKLGPGQSWSDPLQVTATRDELSAGLMVLMAQSISLSEAVDSAQVAAMGGDFLAQAALPSMIDVQTNLARLIAKTAEVLMPEVSAELRELIQRLDKNGNGQMQ